MRTYQLILIGVVARGLFAQVPVTLSPSAAPTAGEPGVTSINVTGSGFPTGQILPANTVVTLQTGSRSPVTTSATDVTTIVGSVCRVTFSIPSSISVSTPAAYLVSISGSTTSGATFASSNQAMLTVNPAASASLSPGQGQQGSQTLSVAITGQYTNFVNGSTQATFGAGISVGGSSAGGMGPVLVTSPTSATATLAIASGAALGARTVSVQTGIENAQISNGFTVTGAPPSTTLSGFSPASAPWGTLVTVTGTGLLASAGSVSQITLQKQGGGTIGAPVSSSASNSLSFVIPSGAATGPLQVTVNGVTVTSATPLIIVPASSFTLAASPNALTVIQGQTVASAVTLNGTNGFNQLVSLNITGLPAGVTASFNPPQITAGQTAILSLNASSAQATSGAVLTLSAVATVSGIAVTQSAALSLSIVGASTSFVGRTVLPDTKETALAGVTVTMLGTDGNGNRTGCSGTAISDSAGNFALTGLAQSCVGRQLVGYDGTTATSPPGKYAGVNLVYTLTAGQVTASPVLVHLPRIDDKETFLVHQNASADQTYAYSSIPGLVLTVYKGTTFTLADGTTPDPFPLVAVQVPVDRLPDQKPYVPTMLQVFIVAFQPANAVASQPVAVSYPNVISTVPGTDMALMTLDPTRGQMVPYGTASVSNDGTEIVPDPDPNYPGHLFGIVHFDWHGPMPPPPAQMNPSPDPNAPSSCRNGCSANNPTCPVCSSKPQAPGDPVDLATGLDVTTSTDIAINGPLAPIVLVRTFRTLTTNPGPFGIGSGHNYAYELDPSAYVRGGGPITLILPNGSRFPFSVQQDGSLTNSTTPFLLGAMLTSPSPEVYNLRWQNGTVFQFQSFGQALSAYLTSITDANGNAITLTHNPSNPGEVTQITDPGGSSLVLSYDSAGRIVTISNPLGQTVRYTYNNQGTLGTFTNAAGQQTQYEYDGQNRLTQVVDARGVTVVQNVYDVNGRVSQQIAADGGVTNFTYTLLNPLAPVSPVLITKSTDPLGRQTAYHFSPQGYLLDVTDASGEVRTFQLQPGTNLLLSLTGSGECPVCGDPREGNVSYAYDGAGNDIEQTDALGNSTKYAYEPVFNNVVSVTDPLGNTLKMSYDANGNLIKSVDGNGNATTFMRNSAGEVTSFTDPLGSTANSSYDSAGRLLAFTDATGRTSKFQYDNVYRLTEVTDSLNRTLSLAYDGLDRVVARTDTDGNSVKYAYDLVENLSSITDERGNKISLTYDNLNRLSTRTSASGKKDSLTYDLDGNVTALLNRNGQTSIFTFDNLNRPAKESYQDGSTVAYSYDAAGRMVQVIDSQAGTFTFLFDSLGRALSNSSPNGTLQYAYDAAGRMTSQQVVGQPKVQYAFDPANNLTSLMTSSASLSLAYDGRNELQKIQRANGVNSAYTYDALGRISEIAHSGGSASLAPITYAFNKSGQRSSATIPNTQPLASLSSSNQYDSDNRIISLVQPAGTTNFTYDGSGNLTSQSGPTGSTSYVWDARGRLTSIANPNGQKTSLVYDFRNNLITQSDSGPALNRIRTFVINDTGNVAYIGQSTGDNLVVLSGRSRDNHFGVVHSNNQVEYSLADALNSTVSTVDERGAVTARFSYQPFGSISSASNYPFQYIGRIPVTSSVYNFRARYYDTDVSRFISEDPAGLVAGDSSLYAYGSNDPTDLVDSNGTFPFNLNWGQLIWDQLKLNPTGLAKDLTGLNDDLKLWAEEAAIDQLIKLIIAEKLKLNELQRKNCKKKLTWKELQELNALSNLLPTTLSALQALINNYDQLRPQVNVDPEFLPTYINNPFH